MSEIRPDCLWPVAAELGEGPIWVESEQAVYFVDIKGQQIHRCTVFGNAQQSWTAPQPIGFLQALSGGDFIAGLKDGLYRFKPADGSFTRCSAVEPHLPGNRLNDAYVDRKGHLWFGSMDDAETAPSGTLYRVGALGELQPKDMGYVITNGPAMSPNGLTFYHTDTMRCVVYAYDVSERGDLTNKRCLLKTRHGYPDGTCVDAEGYLWVALFGGHRVERYSPSGRLVQTVDLPCANATKLAFGGADLRNVFVTTAWKDLSPAERAKQPLAGGLFTFRVDTPGLPLHAITQGFPL
ncbi:SMP-30/gluconolactonase/LRE family protein [Roseateles sp.]|uniref:SMP-30/gluconolactonase/LRE family protein n=1 Tax=Roseateles sp. TaxID=1971397 RepID=UPI003BA4AA92